MSPRSGRANRLTGQVGEYLVVAELARRGYIATTFAGNVPEYDIVATDEKGKHLSIQVKCTTSKTWQFDISRFCEITFDGDQQIIGRVKRCPVNKLVVVLVRLKDTEPSVDQFFLMTWEDLRSALIDEHRKWLEKHGGIRPRNPRSLHVGLPVTAVVEYEQEWDIIDENMH